MQGMTDETANSYVGLTAATAYARLLLSDERMKRVSVFRYRSPPSLQNRIELSKSERALIDRALNFRAETRLPFWTSLFAICLRSGECAPQLVEAAFFHNGPGEPVLFDRNSVETGVLEGLVQSGTANVSLSSEVQGVDGCVRHLSLLDFHCETSPDNEALAALICAQLMPGGYLLIDSGDSYHACGLELLTAHERIYFLGKALLTAPIVDAHYIAHQLQQDVSTIRISKGGKATHEPLVVRAWVPSACPTKGTEVIGIC